MPGCTNLTGYSIDTPVSERVGYVEGAGQPCPNCLGELRKDKRKW